MFIFEYDLLIDNILNTISTKINVDKIDSKNFEKSYNDSIKYINYTNQNKNIQNKITDISKKIIFVYFICCTSFNDDVNKLKTNFIKSKILNSDQISSVFQMIDIIKTILEVINESDKDKLKDLYKKSEKYKNAIDVINEYGYANTINNIKSSKNKTHNLTKLVLFKFYYRKYFRKDVFFLLFYEDFKTKKKINIVNSKLKVIDYISIENILNKEEIKDKIAKEFLDFSKSNEQTLNFKYTPKEKIEQLFRSKLITPITEDFLRFHKQTDKYDKSSKNISDDNIKDQTKLRYTINRSDKIKDFYSKKVVNNKSLQNDIQKLFYRPLIHKKAIIYNEIEEQIIINKILNLSKVDITNNEYYYDL